MWLNGFRLSEQKEFKVRMGRCEQTRKPENFHYLSLSFLHVFSQRGTKVKIFTPLYDHLYCPIDKKTIKKMVHSETSTVYDIGQIKHCINT